MANSIQLRVETAAGLCFDRSVSYVSLPIPGGSIGILSNHAPMLCAVSQGLIRCRDDSGRQYELLTGEGAAQVENNTVTVLCTSAEVKQDM